MNYNGLSKLKFVPSQFVYAHNYDIPRIYLQNSEVDILSVKKFYS